MAVLGGIRVFPSLDSQHQAWQEGRISQTDLALALQRVPDSKLAGLTLDQCVDALHSDTQVPQLPLLIDVLDSGPTHQARLSWRQAVTHQVSQTCAAYFDKQQADWQPERTQGVYAFWRDALQHDHGIGMLMGLPDLGRALDALPLTGQDAERWVLQRLGLPQSVWADYLESVLLTVNGWASWCAYLGWEARLQGTQDAHLRELLAIRLAWGAILRGSRDDAAAAQAFTALQNAWGQAATVLEQAEQTLLIEEVWLLWQQADRTTKIEGTSLAWLAKVTADEANHDIAGDQVETDNGHHTRVETRHAHANVAECDGDGKQ